MARITLEPVSPNARIFCENSILIVQPGWQPSSRRHFFRLSADVKRTNRVPCCYNTCSFKKISRLFFKQYFFRMAENYTTASVTGCSAVEETKHQTKICKYKVCRHYRHSDCCFDMKQDACSGVESACKHQIHYLKRPIPTD